jgi:hypothetical protein
LDKTADLKAKRTAHFWAEREIGKPFKLARGSGYLAFVIAAASGESSRE